MRGGITHTYPAHVQEYWQQLAFHLCWSHVMCALQVEKREMNG